MFIVADADIIKDFKIGDDNVLVKVETDATAFTAAKVFDLATADHFEFAANFSELVANLDYDPSSYDLSVLL